LYVIVLCRTTGWPPLNLQQTPSACITLIVCPLQQWLHERATLLRFTYTAYLVNI